MGPSDRQLNALLCLLQILNSIKGVLRQIFLNSDPRSQRSNRSISMQQNQMHSPCESDFDVGYGEILEYHEGADSPDSIVFSESSFRTTSISIPLFEDSISYNDTKGKSPESSVRDRYHPENSKNEVIGLVERASHGSGQIPASTLWHSAEQWSNYSDLCEAVKVQLRRSGYTNCTVECVTFGTERVICYELY